MQDRYTYIYIYIVFIKGRDSSATQYVCVGADGVFTALILCLIQCKARKSLLILLFRLAWTLFVYRAIASTTALRIKYSSLIRRPFLCYNALRVRTRWFLTAL